jgi:hypothetical protein
MDACPVICLDGNINFEVHNKRSTIEISKALGTDVKSESMNE